MHRHGYKGRKFNRETDQRRALIRALECALIENKSINTTTARAKEIRRETEKLITIAKRGGLANRRLLISKLDSIKTADLLVDVIAPQIKRDSGYLRIEDAGYRRGDNSEMSTISFVDEIDMSKTTKVEKPAKIAKPVKTAEKAEKTVKAPKVPKVESKKESK